MGYDDHGTLEAMDGWNVEWDICHAPHRIEVFNSDDTSQYVISGDIPARYLDRWMGRFLRDHAEQQLAMEV